MVFSIRRVRDILMGELWFFVAVTVLVIILFETELLSPGAFSDDKNFQMMAGMVMVIAVLASIPFSLYLFKLNRVHSSITDKDKPIAKNLLVYGTIRILMLCVPMSLCMLFYYVFGLNVRFFYLSIICALCLFMVYPTMRRCLHETETDPSTRPDDASEGSTTTR